MKIVPLSNRVLIQREEEGISSGGIVIPVTAQEKLGRGIVKAVGCGDTVDGKLVPLALKEGDCVLFSKYSGNEVKVDGQEYIIMKEEDVLATVEK